MNAVTLALAREHPEVRAVILFGSVARHDERPLDDSEPSDVDLLVLVDPGPGLTRLPLEQSKAIHGTALEAECRLPEAPREVQITLVKCALDDWDPAFVENVAADGILLWARGPLPAVLGAVERRAALAPGGGDRPQDAPVA